MCNWNNNNIAGGAKGFSLIEVMVAFSVLTLAFIGIMGSFPRSLSINKSGENISTATFLAQQKLEELRSKDYDEIATGTEESLHRLSSSASDYLYNFQRETLVSNVDANLAATTTDTGLKKISTTVYFINPVSKQQESYNITMLNSQK